MIALRLPYPPSANHYRTVGRGKWYLKPEGKRYHQNVLAEVLSTYGKLRPLKGRIAISIEAVMPDRRKRDIDNIQKIILDSLQEAGVYVNDCQVDEIRVKRLHVEPPGCVDVVIEEVG